jgi:manganese transport protein
VSKVLQLSLGVLAAIGGFIEIGDLVFLSQAGANFGYQLLWVLLLGIVGIMVFGEMAGRVAAVSGRALFDLIRERLGFGLGGVTLVAGMVITMLTLAAELGGVALILQLMFDLPARALMVAAGIAALIVMWRLPFESIERVFSLMGLALLVFVAAAVHLGPDWHEVGAGVVPNWNHADATVYAYFVVGILASTFMPYEVYFYSSGGIEEGWKRPDLRLNRFTVIFGWGLGALLAAALLITAAQLFHPAGIQVDLLGTVALGPQLALGKAGLLLALLGMLFAVGGATAETGLSGAYSMCQFFGWEWGKYRRPRGAPRFVLVWSSMIVLGVLIVLTGVNPVTITEFAVVLGVVALPFTYLPVLLIANDRAYMGDKVNGRFSNALGCFYLALITVVSLAAIPLLIATNMGQG